MDNTSEVLRRIAAAFGYAVQILKRAIDAICQTVRRFAVALSVAVVSGWHPQADRPRLARHLQSCRDPFGRAQYMLSQSRRGHLSPMLA